MIELVIDQRRRDIGGFEVARVLPFSKRRMVGPFIFLDHMGPVDLPNGLAREADVRPHPHVGLSTVTYLFAGEIMHRDSTGVEQAIQPCETNWMIAGSGITHSERSERARREGGVMHAIQSWSRYRMARKKPRLPSRIMRAMICRFIEPAESG
jgi:redox-sensitive bicupin YhaK (pirin superfamily)